VKEITVEELLAFSPTPLTLVTADATPRDVVEKLVRDRETREVYVVDGEGRFLGVITLRRLARLVFSQELPRKPSATELLEMLTVQNAEDLALKKAAHVGLDDSLERVIEVMFRFDINEIPVVDDDGVILGSLNMLDILAAWHQGRLDGLT
jgi:CBS domain-containing protein